MWMPSIEESGIGWSLTLKYSILFWMFKPLDCKFTARLNVVSYNSRVKIKKIAQEIMVTYHSLQTFEG